MYIFKITFHHFQDIFIGKYKIYSASCYLLTNFFVYYLNHYFCKENFKM